MAKQENVWICNKIQLTETNKVRRTSKEQKSRITLVSNFKKEIMIQKDLFVEQQIRHESLIRVRVEQGLAKVAKGGIGYLQEKAYAFSL